MTWTWLDTTVLVAYFLFMAGLGVLAMRKVKQQEDFFLGGRTFGKLLQTFAAFGAGTGANDPVLIGRTTYTSGLSGIWSVLLWLFVTPFYWIFGVWYRRMRHLTLGDWFVERYESRGLGAAYTVFAIYFYMVYLSVAFSAVGKVCVALLGADTIHVPGVGPTDPFFVLLPVISLVVIVYGVLGGLRAAYWTDLVQGMFIILLSIILIPAGLNGLVDKYRPGASMSEGWEVLHNQVSPDYFEILESPLGGEFPLYYIAAITLINLLGIVVQPHFIATGGGSARTENSARIGLVSGNFLKRFCTVGWAITGLIVLALLADNMEIAQDPDRVWGVAAREILGPLQLGLVGLMLACLLAALMSSADCYMLVSSALVVRNLYAAYIDPHATERRYVFVGRVVSVVIIGGAMCIALAFRDVFAQMKETWEITAIFFATFWVGMFWRRATRAAAWVTVVVSALVFFVLPLLLPKLFPELARHEHLTQTTDIEEIFITRPATKADVMRRDAALRITDPEQRQKVLTRTFGLQSSQFDVGDPITVLAARTGGRPIFWTGSARPGPQTTEREISRRTEQHGESTFVYVAKRYEGPLEATGNFNLDFLVYDWLGIELTQMSNPMLETLRFPPRIIGPFALMILLSLVTRRNSPQALDRYYVKMKTPVDPDPQRDRENLQASYENPHRFDHKKLFPGTSLEFQKPTLADVAGFVISFGVCFAIIWFAVWIAQLGAR
jgi:SSS family solute:Na+ symporter